MLKKVLVYIGIVLCTPGQLQAQSPANPWVDSVFSTLSLDDKIGQLFMIPVYPRTDRDYMDRIESIVKSNEAGGIIFMEGGPVEMIHIRNRLQQKSNVPLLIGIDADWGLGKTLDSTLAFPRPLILGAISNDTLLYQMGAEVARQMKTLGIHINFAPSASLTSLQKYDSAWRSYGENNKNVANKTTAYMKGLQDHGVMACAKHFPVQGLTIVDIRKDGLPKLNAYIDPVELLPYKSLFSNGISGVLPAASDFPLFYQKKKMMRKNKFAPALLSSIYVSDWLEKNMDYHGLSFVSILDIVDKASTYKNGEAELLTFQAGNDIILFPEDINPAIRKIKRLIRKNDQYQVQLDNTVKKILLAKYKAGLADTKPISTDYVDARLNTHEALFLKQRLLKSALTIARDKKDVLPLKILEDRKIATLSWAKSVPNVFTKYTSNYTDVSHFSLFPGMDPHNLAGQLSAYETVLVALYKEPTDSLLDVLTTLQPDHDIVICSFASPLQLKQLEKFNTVVQAYLPNDEMVKITAEAIFGAQAITGKLPLTVSDLFKAGQGASVESLRRLSVSTPEEAGMDGEVLTKIESIVKEAIDLRATPGCRVVVARKGKVVYNRSFGYYTYDSTTAVTQETIYDLASVTKVSATLQTVMFMYDKGLIDIYKKASYYLPELKTSNKKDFTVKDILTHQAGLWPYIPFWAQTMKDTQFMPEFYSPTLTANYPLPVTEKLYANILMKDSLWNWIVNAKIRDKVERTPYDYRYSDMGFYILQHLAEKILNQPMEDFLRQNLYDPLGAPTLGFMPLRRFDKSQIAPTEDDKLFRKQLLVGTVHDQGAAMLGGVAGHAGLFSSADDLIKLGQMLLQDGYYGGIQYFSPRTVHLFTRQQYESSRRGLGWDKPAQSEPVNPASAYASPKTFGHTGFTGTCIWVDPEFDLVYVFLSNRVYPDMTNNKLLTVNIRSRIQDTLYQSIFSYCSQYGGEESF